MCCVSLVDQIKGDIRDPRPVPLDDYRWDVFLGGLRDCIAHVSPFGVNVGRCFLQSARSIIEALRKLSSGLGIFQGGPICALTFVFLWEDTQGDVQATGDWEVM